MGSGEFDSLADRPEEVRQGIKVKGAAGMSEAALTQHEWQMACNQDRLTGRGS
jgi:hypothetical protein